MDANHNTADTAMSGSTHSIARETISLKPGAVIPPLPFKVNRQRPHRVTANLVGAARPLANNNTRLPQVTPTPSRPTLQ